MVEVTTAVIQHLTVRHTRAFPPGAGVINRDQRDDISPVLRVHALLLLMGEEQSLYAAESTLYQIHNG
jgi:hypothetical protein